LPRCAGSQADSGYAAASPEAEAERDILLTDALARLLYQLHYGKVDPRRLDPNWNVGRPALAGNVLEILEEALEKDDVAGMVERARPSDPAYLGLRRGLARYRAIEAAGGWRQLPPGPLLRPGMTDPAIPILRERLMATGDLRDVPDGAADQFDRARSRRASDAFRRAMAWMSTGSSGPRPAPRSTCRWASASTSSESISSAPGGCFASPTMM
jgi:murein L,D-transpeptidase YcbB/YkuD